MKKIFITAPFLFLIFSVPLTLFISQQQQITNQHAATTQNTFIYYGEHTPPWYPDFSGIPPLETMTGKQVSIVMGYTQWNRTDGVQNFNSSWFNQIRAHGSIPMLTWEPWVSLQTIYNGNYDAYITKWAQDSKSWGHPYFLRLAHEMNGDWYPWSERVNNSHPGDYVKAWKHVHDMFTANGVKNVTWIWCPNVEGTGDTPLPELYPGDNYVDWTCMDGYNFGGETFSQIFNQTYKDILQIAPTKPVMIAETNSIEDGNKPAWVTDALTIQLPQKFPNIKAIVWYDSNFNGRTDWVINSSQASLNAFKTAIASTYYASNTFGNITSSPIAPINGSTIPNITPTTPVLISPTPIHLPPSLAVSKIPTPTSFAPTPNHFLGGFSIESNAEIANAAADGIGATLIYGYAPLPTDSVGQQLIAHNMKLIDAMPEEYLYYYECHIHNTCSASTFPELTSVQALLNDLTTHLQQAKNNPLVIGYWTLDDWNYGDGTGKDLLIQINTLIHQYTPGKPSICGFGGGLSPSGKGGSVDSTTLDNFTPQGCDMVGLYIYADSNSTGTYDWGMSSVLPSVFSGLKSRGWDITKTPLVGIPQAFGGVDDQGSNWPLPDAAAVEAQTKAYCQNGATGIVYYAWGGAAQSPLNNAQITLGVKNGNADCQKIWNTTGISPTATQGQTTISLTICPHGLGNCGDNANPHGGGNQHPQHPQRSLNLTLLNSTNQLVGTTQGTVTYNQTVQNFQGTVSLGNIQGGSYLIVIKIPGYLSKQIPGIITIPQPSSLTQLPPLALTTGDINNDNQLDILDYNLFISCYGSKQNSPTCHTPPTSQTPGADLTDDGIIDGADYNLFLRELSVQKGG